MEAYKTNFQVMNLLQLSEQQQRNVIQMQLAGNAFFEHRAQFHGQALTATQTSANRTTFELLDLVERLLSESGMPSLAQSGGALNYLSTVIQAQASTLGFQDTFLMIAVVALIATGPAWMIGQTGKNRQR